MSYVPTGPSFFKTGKILAYSKLTSTFHSQIRLNQIHLAKCIYLTALATWQPKVKKNIAIKKCFLRLMDIPRLPTPTTRGHSSSVNLLPKTKSNVRSGCSLLHGCEAQVATLA